MRWLSSLVGLILYGLMTGSAVAANLDDTQKLLFVADREKPFIDVISLSEREAVHRLPIKHVADSVVVSPYTPVLAYAHMASSVLTVVDISEEKVLAELALPLVPRHLVLNTTGSHVGITDSEGGGFALVNLFTQEIELELAEFPATADVLFDANEVDIYYVDPDAGAFGIIDLNYRRYGHAPLPGLDKPHLLSPSRSLDGRYLYLADENNGVVYGLNSFSKVIFKTFSVGEGPARPYTTPEGHFLYLFDRDTGKFASFDQFQFEPYAELDLPKGIDMVATGRFDRMNLFVSSSGKSWILFDNVTRKITGRGEFEDIPLDILAAADGKTAYVSFGEAARLAVFDLEDGELKYIPATENGAGAFTLGLSNDVCH